MYTVSWNFWVFWYAMGPSQLPHNWNSLSILSENMLDNSNISILTYFLKSRIELWNSIRDFFLQKLGNQDPVMLRGFDMSEHSCEELGYFMLCKTPFCNHCVTPKKIVFRCCFIQSCLNSRLCVYCHESVTGCDLALSLLGVITTGIMPTLKLLPT